MHAQPPTALSPLLAAPSVAAHTRAMTTAVRVWEGDLYLCAFPPLCAVTGEPTNGRWGVRFSTTPRWVILLILLGVVPFIVGWLITRRVASGSVPMSPRARRLLARNRIIAPVAVIGGVVLVFTAAFVSSVVAPDATGWIVVVGLLAVLVGCIPFAWWMRRTDILGYVEERTPWGRWVVLSHVNPTFAAAVERMYAQRSAPTLWPPCPPPVAPPPIALGSH
jgi:hypothetical protein